MSSPSMKHYAPVQDEDGLHDEDDSHQEQTHEDNSTADGDINDLHHIRIESSDDSDDRTEPTSNIHQNPFSFDLDKEEDEL